MAAPLTITAVRDTRVHSRPARDPVRALSRTAFCALLDSCPDITVIAQAADLEETVRPSSPRGSSAGRRRGLD